MKISHRLIPIVRDQKGATAVIVAIAIAVLIGFTALAIDVGYLYATRNELQNIADAAALAGAGQLGYIYKDGAPYDHATHSAAVIQKAEDIAKENQAGGKSPIVIMSGEVQIGYWDRDPSDPSADPFTAYPDTVGHPDQDPFAVRVKARRDSAINEKVSTFFANIFGISAVPISVVATAALGGLSHVGEGEIELPIGISYEWFDEDYCGQPIKFHPTSDSSGCAGWTMFEGDHPYNTIKKVVEGMVEEEQSGNGFESPEIDFDEQPEIFFDFTGGDIATLFNGDPSPLQFLFDAHKFFHPMFGGDGDAIAYDGDDGPAVDEEGDPLYIPDTDPPEKYPDLINGVTMGKYVWETFVLVHADPCSDNPNQSIKIIGAAKTYVTKMIGPPDKTIEAVVICNLIEFGRGSGDPYGTLGSIPHLVQ
jgi:Flp pilus assembly protein TadG